MSPEIKDVSWKELYGNKFNKSLHPAMLTEEGYVSLVRIRKIGSREKDAFNVTYDREYALEFLHKKVCRPLSYLGKEKLIEAINEAWDLYGKDCLTPHLVNQTID